MSIIKQPTHDYKLGLDGCGEKCETENFSILAEIKVDDVLCNISYFL